MHRTEGRRNRGQLILITALLIAVLFVSLALIVNSAVYTENLSTRSTGSSDGAIQATTSSVEEVDIMLDRVNNHHNTTYDDLTQNYTKMTTGYQHPLAVRSAERGTFFQLTVADQTNGTFLQQTNQTRNYTNASGDDSDWHLDDGITGVSDFTMEVNRNDLYSNDDIDPSDRLANSYSVHITDENGADWEFHIYENSSNVTVKPIVDGIAQASCEVDASQVRIDFVAGTVAGRSCPTLNFAEGLDGALDVEYRDPDQISGSYALRVDTIIDPVSNAHYAEPGAGQPSATPNIYATTIRLAYTNSQTSLISKRRIVAGDPAYAG